MSGPPRRFRPDNTPTTAALCVVSSALLMFALGSLYAWSVFIQPLQGELGVSRSAVSAVFSVATLCFTATMVVGPRTYRYAGAPTLAAATCLLAAAGLALSGWGSTLWAVGLGYGGLFGIANGIGYGLSLQIVNTALPERRGLMTGIVVACYTSGAAAFTPAFQLGIGTVGVRATFLAAAGFMVGAGVAAFALLRAAGVALPQHPEARRPGASGVPYRPVLFWRLWLGFFFGALAGLMSLGHAAAIVASFGGTAQQLTAGTALVALGNTGGRFVGGALCDRFPARHVLSFVALVAAGALFGLLLAPGAGSAIAALGLVGLGYGSMAGAYPVVTSYFFGAASVGRIYGRLFTAWGAAGLIAPYVAGRLFDAHGSYRLAIALGAGAALLAAIASLTLPRTALDGTRDASP